MTDLTTLSLHEAAKLIKSKQVSPVDVTQACLDRATATEDRLHAFSAIMADGALDEARHAESEIAAGNWKGELHGIPVGIRELYDVAGWPTTSSSQVRANWSAKTDSASVAQTGLPSTATPCGFTQGGLPIGFQAIARPFGEAMSIRVCDAYQGMTDSHERRPAM